MEVGLRFWIEFEGKPVMGRGGYDILKNIEKFQSISKASRALGMSYRFIWDYIRRMENVLGERVVESEKGGVEGGRTTLTPLGKKLIDIYENFENTLKSALNGVRGIVEEVGENKVVITLDNNEFNIGDAVVIFKNGKIPRVKVK
ncbi:winged helix-turn-helix domain-containing protein [Archaeoglobus profundus]|uniref:Transcriptional regulator, ModE family n=1 Tax=Archaeoglobus profundus (strain DSM 5631 / JCM 9629 / NBRC 100127 / Av18) TaxID=572546 RepID=D2RFG5_ARCPA|nr:winged helix-turn-helix domain-containing protein [Archaeoglobus profundus]ADB58859.1 putative transcriptional regulator, ModE family [Archaeoglobus profundus DSM 5631]